MVQRRCRQLLWCIALALCGHAAAAEEAASPPPAAALTPAAPVAPPSLSSTAERVYEAARPSLLQIRTLLEAAGRQSSLGSGFLVNGEGMAITNYHVVSQYAFEPSTYRLEYAAPDGSRGALKLLAFDIANDLAVVQLDKRDQPFFQFDTRALQGTLPKGERLYSMGNPLDLGFTIVEGTYNGLVERSYNDRIHFSGAINAGMSGGPTVSADGRIAGINVAKQLGSDLVSFLVPARFAAVLIERAQSGKPLSPADSRAEVGRQLSAWQAKFYQAIAEQGLRGASFGPYQAPESAARWFTCWARTNANQVPKPRATVNMTNCNTDTWLFIADDLNTGVVRFSHSYVRSVDLNQFQFATFLSQQSQPGSLEGWSPKRYTRQRCHESFMGDSTLTGRPLVRAVWCARAYREFAGLYDVSVTAVTEDRGSEALVSRLSMQGVAYENAVQLTKRFLGAVRWAK
jgi:serine protease Do